MSVSVRLRCKRCHEDYELVPGEGLTVFCSTCRHRYGARLYEDEQTGLNRRHEWSKEQMERAPWGHPDKELNKKLIFLPGIPLKP